MTEEMGGGDDKVADAAGLEVEEEVGEVRGGGGAADGAGGTE